MYRDDDNVKVDLSVRGSSGVVISSRVVRLLGAEVGDVPTLRYEGSEVLLGLVGRSKRGQYTGRLYRRGRHSGTLTCSNRAMVQALGEGARFRCGEAVTRDGVTYVTIITRRNYGKTGD